MDKKEYQKNYRQNNKEKIQNLKKIYYDKNREEIIEKNKLYNLENKQKKKDYQKEYYIRTRTKQNEKNEKYRKNNADLIKEKRNSKVKCDRCNCIVSRGYLTKHTKTKKCINYKCD